MTDKDFAALSLRSSLCPGLEVEWDPPEYQHWQDLHAAALELRGVVGNARASVAAIEKDKDLAAPGRVRRKQELVRQTLVQLDKLPSITKARESVAAITAKWQSKIEAMLTKPEADDAATALLHREVRDKLASLKDETARIQWIQKFGSDPTVVSALLHAPTGLTNLSQAEMALLTNKAESLADSRIVAAKGKVTKAMAELERAVRAAPDLVASAAGLKAAAIRPLPSKPELPNVATPKDETSKVTPLKAGGPHWPTTNSGPGPTGGPQWS